MQLQAQFSTGSPQAGLRPRSETPNVGGPFKPTSAFDMEKLTAERRALNTKFETGTAISVKTDVL